MRVIRINLSREATASPTDRERGVRGRGAAGKGPLPAVNVTEFKCHVRIFQGMRILPAIESEGMGKIRAEGGHGRFAVAWPIPRRSALNSASVARRGALIALLLSVWTVWPASQPAAGQDTARTPLPVYRIDTGDRITITVYQEPDLSVQGVRVKADGTIAFPLLGDLRVAGLTSQELQAMITRELLDGYLKKPSVTVSIDDYRLYYIKGEVARPGGYSYVDGLTVAKAVALAGGFTVRASKKRISLVREANPDEPVESVDLNAPILPGDVVTVGESFF